MNNSDPETTMLPLNLSKIGPATIDPTTYPTLREVIKNPISPKDLIEYFVMQKISRHTLKKFTILYDFLNKLMQDQ